MFSYFHTLSCFQLGGKGSFYGFITSYILHLVGLGPLNWVGQKVGFNIFIPHISFGVFIFSYIISIFGLDNEKVVIFSTF